MKAMKAMKVLAIDTATEACSVALNLNGTISQQFEVAPNGHSRIVLGMVDSVLRDGGIELRDLDALAVDVGPGSFTGVRIGVGVAQGLSYGGGCAIIACNSLEILAGGVCQNRKRIASDNDAIILPAIDARMGQIYYALFESFEADAESNPREITAPTLLPTLAPTLAPTLGWPTTPATHVKLADGSAGKKLIGIGSGWDVYEQVMRKSFSECAPDCAVEFTANCYPEARVLAKLAAMRGIETACAAGDLRIEYVRNEVATPPKNLAPKTITPK